MPDYTDINLSSTVYNVLTKARYDALANNSQINENELYLITDDRFVATDSTTWNELYDHREDNPPPIFETSSGEILEHFYYDDNGDIFYFTHLYINTGTGTSIQDHVAYLESTGGWHEFWGDLSLVGMQSVNSTSKLYLVGATQQSYNTYGRSNINVYATNGVLNAKSFSVDASANIVYNSSSKSIDFTFV